MARRITATRKAWDELTPNEKADLVHKENRQLHYLLRSTAIAQPAPAAIVAGRLQRNRRFVDSPLEGTGFELLVRGRGEPGCHARLLEMGRRAFDHFIGYPTAGYAFGDRGGRVAPPAADPSQATGRVERRDNQFTAPATRSSNPVPSSGESTNLRFL